MEVFRVENAYGNGPFNALPIPIGGAFELKRVDFGPYTLQPSSVPQLDRVTSEHFKYGVKSLADLRKWFKVSGLRKLYDQGFKVVKYDIDSKAVIKGAREVNFPLPKAKKVESFDTFMHLTKQLRKEKVIE